jgi:peptidoglycan/LPS O-acetylase OafA/YrhL
MTRRPALDGLRGLAIAAVVCMHAFRYPRGGASGVDLFFVLSGYLITAILLREHDTRGAVSIRAFYRRRARRILPALLTMLSVISIVLLGSSLDGRNVTKPALGIAAALTFSTNFVLGLAHTGTSYLLPLWSLAVEEQFYLVWPLLLVFLLRGHRGWMVGALVLLIGASTTARIILPQLGASEPRIDYLPDTRAVGIPIGCLCAVLLASPASQHVRRAVRWLVPLAVLIIALETAFISGTAPLWLTLFTMSVAVLIVRTHDEGSWTARALAWKPLSGLGLVSYSLYLWHMPILVGLGLVGRGIEGELVGVALAVGAAVLSYRFVERRFLAVGRDATAQPSGTDLVGSYLAQSDAVS